MNKHDLFEAIGGIDEELLEQSEYRVPRKLPVRKLLFAAAAVMVLAVTAMAGPAIADLLFPTNDDLISEGAIVQGIDGKIFAYSNMYQIDFTLENTESVPTSIEAYMIPTYFDEMNWYQDYGYSMTEINHYPSVKYMWLSAPESNTWVVFEQAVFHSDTPKTPLGSKQFYLGVPTEWTLTKETLKIGGSELSSYLTCYEKMMGERHIYWTDGQYAYHLTATTDLEAEQLGQIIASVAPVEDNSAYLKAGEYMVMLPLDPIETYYVPSAIPDGFRPIVCEDEIYETRLSWAKDDECIVFQQSSEKSTSFILANYEFFGLLVRVEEVQLGDQPVFFAALESGCAAVWETETDQFHLEWNGNENIGKDELTALVESLQAVENISEYMTD